MGLPASMSTKNEREQQEKLIEMVQEALRSDNALREKHEVGVKFRFVQDRLQALLEQLEGNLKTLVPEKKSNEDLQLAQDVCVYVYLFNAEGMTVADWTASLLPKVFYEYSINRPIYAEKNHIDAVIRAKKNKLQHGYLTIAIQPEDILSNEETALLKDSAGNPLVKVKEGSLRFEKLTAFTHNEQDYVVDEKGKLVKKNGSTLS